MYMLNGQRLDPHSGFTATVMVNHPVPAVMATDESGRRVEVEPPRIDQRPDEQQFPPGWLLRATPTQLEELGIVEVPDPAPINARFHFVSGDGAPVPRAVEDVREMLVKEAKQKAFTLLAASDWKIQRASDPSDGTPVDQATIDYRGAVRAACTAREAAIAACETTDELEALEPSLPAWPELPA